MDRTHRIVSHAYLALAIGLVVVGAIVFRIIEQRATVALLGDTEIVRGTKKNFVPRNVAADKASSTKGVTGATSTATSSLSLVLGESIVLSTGTTPFTPGASVHIVRFTDDGYVPKELTVRRGDTVRFMNESYVLFMWPTLGTGAEAGYGKEYVCTPNTFDACARIPIGEGWSYTFRNQGAWTYHDHISPMFEAIVVVE